jgi:hypothetical protein
VKQILKKGLDQLPQVDRAFDILSETYTGSGRFCRNSGSLLAH